MFKSTSITILVSLLFFGIGVSSTFASETDISDDKSIDFYWDQSRTLSNETTLKHEEKKSDTIGTSAVWYHEWGKGTMSLEFSDFGSTDNLPNASFPVSEMKATGETVRDFAVGTSSVVTLLMRDGSEVSRKQDSSTLSKTASASVLIRPGSVPIGTEYRAHGTHTIAKALGHTVGYTGDRLGFF